ncbi:hypothetical protein PVL29_025584 [Vitis rotundifolia]|uniref:F-box associated beta-propeller type 3 domain-containing protein n=1 Tax=Vitis rotundifolia TaxID=103349 RepID=A0AA38YKA9_VITRO|nr:hypothetical protein PVL29_025584 [Vitis rotundifolia]
MQLNRSLENPCYVFYPCACWNRNIHFLTKTDGETTETISGCDRYYFTGMICSFNGLICCVNYEGCSFCKWVRRSGRQDIRICNPATREVLLLPQGRKSEDVPKIGVAFGPGINEYKIFWFFFPRCSLKHVCINGIVYWFIKYEKGGLIVGSILAVDMEEKFSLISIPEEETLYPFLVNLEDCLCLVAESRLEKNRFDIWALQNSKDYVWVKKWSDYMRSFNIKHVNHIAVRKNEILFGSLEHYFFYDMETRTWRELNWAHGCQDLFSFPMVYTESLLPCKC